MAILQRTEQVYVHLFTVVMISTSTLCASVGRDGIAKIPVKRRKVGPVLFEQAWLTLVRSRQE